MRHKRNIRQANEVACKQERNNFADYVQNLATEKLQSLGYEVKTNPINDSRFKYDLEATNGITIRIEVKGARCCPSGRRGKRYRATLSKKSTADILLFYCQPVWFVIPICEIYPRGQISIWSQDATKTKGQWQKFIEAWDLLSEYDF